MDAEEETIQGYLGIIDSLHVELMYGTPAPTGVHDGGAGAP
ncbi:hypothetical protein ACH9D2_12680 [Kocuria sp. M4R2S49]